MRNIPTFVRWSFLAAAIIFMASPIWLYWYVHGNYERYMRIIEGPLPIGSGPFQLFLGVSLFAVGVVCLVISVLLFKMSKFR